MPILVFCKVFPYTTLISMLNVLRHYSVCLLLSTDVNDNVPFFTSSIYEASVTEGVEVGTLVLQVSANDLDLGLNGKVHYKAIKLLFIAYSFNLKV